MVRPQINGEMKMSLFSKLMSKLVEKTGWFSELAVLDEYYSQDGTMWCKIGWFEDLVDKQVYFHVGRVTRGKIEEKVEFTDEDAAFECYDAMRDLIDATNEARAARLHLSPNQLSRLTDQELVEYSEKLGLFRIRKLRRTRKDVLALG